MRVTKRIVCVFIALCTVAMTVLSSCGGGDGKIQGEDNTSEIAVDLDYSKYSSTMLYDAMGKLSAEERRAFARGERKVDPSLCTYRVDKVCIKELRYELFDGRTDRDLRIGDILDALPGWKKGKTGRNRAYADWPVPMWVRMDSEADRREAT